MTSKEHKLEELKHVNRPGRSVCYSMLSRMGRVYRPSGFHQRINKNPMNREDCGPI